MKIVLCTTPIRPVPTSYPPFGSMAIIQSLRAAGYDPALYDIDGLRPSLEDVEKFFRESQPDVVGISAVVSTAYAYTKGLTRLLRRACPKARVVVGGNLAASAEILHRLAGVDVCVIGEGELIVRNLMRALEGSPARLDPGALEGVPGITFLRPDGELRFTGYERRLPPDEVFRPDFGILERYSRLPNFINDPFERADFAGDPRTHEPHRKGKKMATLVTAKGCVARCTFCHRWDKGYRTVPVQQIIDHVKLLMERYDVGLITFTDENFGSDSRHAEELVRALKPLDILWQVGGVRVRSTGLPLLRAMRDAGCVAVYYGMETGSPRMLEVMEKKATVQDNLNAAAWAQEAGLFTIFQMVLGMPGESPETIRETIEFLKTVTQDLPESPRSRMSLNYIQALPGTPAYEYARLKGLIGTSLADEERYLLAISDTEADDDTRMINFTDYDYLTVRSWRREVVLEVMRHYREHRGERAPGLPAFLRRVARAKFGGAPRPAADAHEQAKNKVLEDYARGGYFNLQRDLGYDAIVAYLYPFRRLILWAWLLQDEFRRLSLGEFIRDVAAAIRGRLPGGRPAEAGPAVSLRQTVAALTPRPATRTQEAMAPLREGR